MSLLLDTNICSEHLRDPRRLFSRFVQYAGNLFTSRIVLAELYVWAYLSPGPGRRLEAIDGLVELVHIVEFDDETARRFGQTKVAMERQGFAIPTMDLMIAVSALVHGLTLVTHNVRDFENVPDLRVVDWLT